MATKAKTQSAATADMFAVEDRPKREGGNFKGRSTDPAKLALVTDMLTKFAAFAAEQGDALEGKDIRVTELGDWTPAALAITGNNILDNQTEANGKHPGFYLVATDRPQEENDKGEKVYGQPRKLVFRIGQKPTRNRNSQNGEADTE